MNKSVERDNLLSFFNSALESVQGRAAVKKYLHSNRIDSEKIALLAIGKAASSMLEGAVDILGDKIVTGLLITKDGHLGDTEKFENIEYLLASHPVPDERSLFAGNRLIEWLVALPADLPLVVLISGGTSSLVEKLPEGLGLSNIQKLNQWLLSSGMPIDQMNRIRQSISLIKGGRLAIYTAGRPVIQLLISDVPGDDPAVIGSGLFVANESRSGSYGKLPTWLVEMQTRAADSIVRSLSTEQDIKTTVIANNKIACVVVQQNAEAAGYKGCIVSTSLDGDVVSCAAKIMAYVDVADTGCYVWGGETTTQLPEHPGRGGRNQHLALLLAQKIQDKPNIYILCAGTDGTDGPTEDAGALVDSDSIRRGVQEGLEVNSALENADAGTFLAASGDLVNTGPTGTNVMDLVIVLKV